MLSDYILNKRRYTWRMLGKNNVECTLSYFHKQHGWVSVGKVIYKNFYELRGGK